jgi:hypothetical protein
MSDYQKHTYQKESYKEWLKIPKEIRDNLENQYKKNNCIVKKYVDKGIIEKWKCYIDDNSCFCDKNMCWWIK